jgi:hypothetical protein
MPKDKPRTPSWPGFVIQCKQSHERMAEQVFTVSLFQVLPKKNGVRRDHAIRYRGT